MAATHDKSSRKRIHAVQELKMTVKILWQKAVCLRIRALLNKESA
jgi:hypothetical protein